MSATPDIVMVHGAFCGGWVFEDFRAPFEAAGYRCLTPDLRGHGRSDPSGAVKGVSMRDYAQDIAELVGALPRPPILIGHSLGGLVAQLASVRAPARALILLAPSPPWGVAGGTLEEAASAVSLYALGAFWTQAIHPDYTAASLYSLNRLPEAERKAAFGRMVPESGRALWETLNWWLDPFMSTAVARMTAPALAVAGSSDVIHPPQTVRQSAQRIGAEVQVFEDMSHWLPAEPGWEAVASACLGWLARQETPANA